MCSAENRPRNPAGEAGALNTPDFRAALDALPMAVYTTDADGIVTYCNRAAASLAGREPELGKDRWCVSWKLHRPDGSVMPDDQCPMAQALRQRQPVRGEELVVVRPDGEMVPVLPFPTPVFDKSGALAGAINLLLDIGNDNSRWKDSLRLAAIVESSNDAIVAKDLSGTITSWNKGAERLFGYSADEVLGKSITLLIPASHQHEEPEILRRVRSGERIEHFETTRRHKDGHLVEISLTVSPIRDAAGRIIGASKIARDITDQKRTEMAMAARLREQWSLFQLTERLQRAQDIEEIYDAALDAIHTALACQRASIQLFVESATMRFVAWRGLSEQYRRAVDGLFPWTAETKDPEPIFVDDIAQADLAEELRLIIASEGIGALGFIPLVAEGMLIGKFMTYYDSPHVFADTEVSVALTIARQLGFSVQRTRAEQARRQAERQLRHNEANERARAAELLAIMEAVPAMIWIARTPDCRIIEGNRAAHALLRLPPDANLSLSAPPGERPDNFRIFAKGEMLTPDTLPVQRAARGEEVQNFEQEIRFDDGTSRYLFGNATPLRDAAGEVIGAVAAFVDITERKQTEQALQESERRLQIALDAGRMGVWEWNIATGEMIWSPGLEALHGLEPGTFGGTLRDFARDVHPDDAAYVEQEIARAIERRENYHAVYRISLADGTMRWIESFGQFSPHKDTGAPRLVGVSMDITERKAAEAQRNLLVAELSHRVKNTLAIVSSIARQSFSTNPDARDAHRSFDARLRALAQTHTRLAEANWSGVSLETVMFDELAPYHDKHRNNVFLTGPPAMLPPKYALTLGMAAHELATNAVKHGALSVKTGSVDIGWVRDPERDRLRIRWSERGGPPVPTPTHNGFGRLLLERVVASDLAGEVGLDFASEGLTCTIDVPYPRGATA